MSSTIDAVSIVSRIISPVVVVRCRTARPWASLSIETGETGAW
jgi:hypothetical protein